MTKSELANEIVQARQNGEQSMVVMPDPPMTVSDAEDIQTLVFESFGERSLGWKVGAASDAAQKAFGLDAPFFGPMAASGLVENGGDLKKTPCVGAVEPEYAFRMARDFPAEGEEINATNAADAVGSVHIAIEVIGRCLGDASFANGIGVTMDFAGNAAFLVGDEISNWRDADLVNAPVEAMVDGEVVQTGSGAAVLGDPMTALVWMAQTLADRGATLKAGDWVSTGTCTPAVPAKAGSTVSAKFGDFGTASIRFV